jgi:hypothetical protein
MQLTAQLLEGEQGIGAVRKMFTGLAVQEPPVIVDRSGGVAGQCPRGGGGTLPT